MLHPAIATSSFHNSFKIIKWQVERVVAVLTFQTALELTHRDADNLSFFVNIENTAVAIFPATIIMTSREHLLH